MIFKSLSWFAISIFIFGINYWTILKIYQLIYYHHRVVFEPIHTRETLLITQKLRTVIYMLEHYLHIVIKGSFEKVIIQNGISRLFINFSALKTIRISVTFSSKYICIIYQNSERE